MHSFEFAFDLAKYIFSKEIVVLKDNDSDENYLLHQQK